jgi:tetratricopeptide (TPR) repeat protein
MSNTSVNAIKAREQAQKTFDKAVDSLHKKKWANARSDFHKVAEAQPGTGLAERSRRYLAVCEDRLAKPASKIDSYLVAVMAKNEGDLETAMEVCSRGGAKGRDERFAYLAAALECLQENTDAALEQLAKAIELNSENRVHAYHDPDFSFLRDDPEHAALFVAE